MKKSSNSSVDGFIPRRSGSELGDLHKVKDPDSAVAPIDRSLHTGDNISSEHVGKARKGAIIGRDDIDQSLREIDDTSDSGKKSKKRRRVKPNKVDRPRRKVWRIIKWVIISLLIIGALVGGYVVLKAVFASNNVFQGSIFNIVQSQRLKEDENGRSNFVIFGTAEDDQGGEHGGRNLTDSIMLLSIDQDKKNAYMLSLPRDLWVKYQEICTVGNQGKLNAAYYCASDDGENEPAGAAALQAKVGEITGVDVQYYVHLNFTAVVEAVDAVGGVDVTVETSDPRGILDRNFDWKCGYKCYYVNYKNGEVAHMDGEHALAFSRARNAQGGYGLPGGNFDREKNQQKVIQALLAKAVSAGTLTNIGAVTGLIDALGGNLRTNIETKEIRTLMDIGIKVKPENIVSLTLVGEDNMLVTTGSHNGQSIVRPVAGLLTYSEIIAYVEENLTADEVTKEDPHVMVLNGSGTSGVAQSESDLLIEKGFAVDTIGNAPAGTYEDFEVYQINLEKTASADRLKEIYGVTLKTTTPPMSVTGEIDFVIVVGKPRSNP